MAFYPQYAPEYQVRINGQNLATKLRNSIMSVRFDNGLSATDKVEIQFADISANLIDDSTLGLYNELALSVGYAGKPLEEVFVGEITGRQASFSGGANTFTVEASDFSHRLMQGQKERGFGPLPDPAIVVFIAIENGLIPMTDPGGAALAGLAALLGKSSLQQNETDHEFLTRIAANSGIKFTVEKRTLFFRLFQEFQPAMTLTWGQNLLDFSPRISIVGQIEGVAIKVWLRELKLSFVITVGWDFDAKRLAIDVVPGFAEIASEKATFKFLDQGIKDPTDFAKVLLKAYSELKQKLNQRLTGSASVVGNNAIRAGMVIDIAGVGSEFGGNYRVSSVSHSLDSSGWKTNMNINREIIPEVFA